MNRQRSVWLLVLTACLNLPAADIVRSAERYEWQLVNKKAAWAARDGAGILSFQGKMWLLGGQLAGRWGPNEQKN